MDNIPPEIWAKIFENLDDKDCWNASNVCTAWRQVLALFRSCWMFAEVFPLLVQYISKCDILQCRKVCKRWCLGVDNFLESNGYHCPAYNHFDLWNNAIHQSDLRSKTISRLLHSKNILYHPSSDSRELKKRVIDDIIAKEHPRCPIVGRASFMWLSLNLNYNPSNMMYLKLFGRHIWFLKVVVRNISAVPTLLDILEILSYTPNLKKLELDSEVSSQRFLPEPMELVTGISIPQQLAGILQTRLSEEDRQKLKRLETVKLVIAGCHYEELTDTLLELFCGESLQSLSLNAWSGRSEFGTENLVDLSLDIDTEVALQKLLQLRSPIRKLSLTLKCRGNGTALFGPINHFGETLRNLELELTPEFYDEENGSPEELHQFLEPFHNRDILQNCSKLKRVSLEGCRPLSLNFLCGLKANLEYLHVSMENIRRWGKFLKVVSMGMQFKEELDLLEKLRKPPSSPEDKVIYKSNVWKYFPKFKAMTVHWLNDKKGDRPEIEYRRDTYDKLQANARSAMENK